MSNQPAIPADTSANRLPPQTKYIVGNEACERFSYYGIRSILAGYITGEVARGGLGQSADTSTTIIHLFIFANYFMPLLGAWLSDKLIGRYNTILYVSMVYCAGNAVLACSDLMATVSAKMVCLAAGLGLIAFGSGGIKPCVSAFMGDQFKPEQGHLLQKAYGAFYWSINFGSFFSFLIIPWIKDLHGYGWAFGVPGLLMALAILIFWLGTKHYTMVPPARATKTPGFLTVFLCAFRHQPRVTLAPVVNILASLALPMVTMIVFTLVALLPTSPTFSESHLKDLPQFIAKLAQPGNALSTYLASNLSADTLEVLQQTENLAAAPASVKAALLDDLNAVLARGALYEPLHFQGVTLRGGTQQLLARQPTGEDLVWLNRLLLEDAYPAELGRVSMSLAKTVKGIGWISLVAVGVWYLLIVALSLFSRMDLPDGFWQAARARHSESEISAARSVGPILFVFALIPVFWALFDQTTSTWVLQGKRMVPLHLFAGGTNFSGSEIKDLPGLAAKLKQGRGTVSHYLTNRFSAETLKTLAEYQGPKSDAAPLRTDLVRELNAVIHGALIYETNRFAKVALQPAAREMLERGPQGVEVARLNRLLLQDAYAAELALPGFSIGAEQMQSANPALVMVLVPLLTLLLYPRLGRLATPLRRMSAGMFLAAASYVIVAWLQERIESGAYLNVLWQTLPYIILTTGEVLLSTTGLEFAFAEAAPSMRSTIMSFWLLTVAFGNLVVTTITQVMTGGEGAAAHAGSVTPSRFLLYAGLTAVVGVLFSLVAARYRYRHPSFRALSE
jgi:dipeptide/tripeptide permease